MNNLLHIDPETVVRKRRVMSELCKKCGAEITYETGNQSQKCPYCDAINETKRSDDGLPNEIDKIIRLSLSADALDWKVYRYVADNEHTPDDMLEMMTFISRDFMYAPVFVFDFEYKADWSASFGYERKESYTDYRTVTSNGHRHREPYTAYRTVTDWHPASGVDSGTFRLAEYAGEELNSNSSQGIVTSLAKKRDGVTFDNSFLSGIKTEPFLLSDDRAYSRVKHFISNKIEENIKKHQGKGNRQKDWNWSGEHWYSMQKIYVPICHSVFDYKGESYHYWIDGIGYGEPNATPLPKDKNRDVDIYVGMIPAGISIVAFLLCWYIWGFQTLAFSVLGVIGGGYATLREKSIRKYSKQFRDSILKQIKASATSAIDPETEEARQLARSFQRPEKPFLAKTQNDIYVLPTVTLISLVGVIASSYYLNPEVKLRRQADHVQITQNSTNESTPTPVKTASPEPIVSTSTTPYTNTEKSKIIDASPEPTQSTGTTLVPSLEGRVTDVAKVLPVADRVRLSIMLAHYERETSHQIAVLTIPTLSDESIEAFSLRVANSWGLGKKDLNNGILVLLAMKERKVRIELGLGMAKFISDTTAQNIIQTSMIPAFREGDYAGGIQLGLERLMQEARRFVITPSDLQTEEQERIAKHEEGRNKQIETEQRAKAEAEMRTLIEARAKAEAAQQQEELLRRQQQAQQQKTVQAAQNASPMDGSTSIQQVPENVSALDPRERCAKKDNFISMQICEARACEKPKYMRHPYCERYRQ